MKTSHAVNRAATSLIVLSADDDLHKIAQSLADGQLIAFLGPGLLALCPDYAVPGAPEALVTKLTARASVPPKIKNNLTRSAQFIENFKHRKTLVNLMNEAFSSSPSYSTLHQALARLNVPMIVDTWYDDAMATALRDHQNESPSSGWWQIQGLSQSEHFGKWTGQYSADGAVLDIAGRDAGTLLYKPLGSHAPAANYLVSDTDFVEVLTEIDIQTPIPDIVKTLRSTRGFLFMGCRFNDQLSRTFARQIMKRSAGPHFAVLPEAPTRMEARFLEEQGIVRISMNLHQFADQIIGCLDQAILQSELG